MRSLPPLMIPSSITLTLSQRHQAARGCQRERSFSLLHRPPPILHGARARSWRPCQPLETFALEVQVQDLQRRFHQVLYDSGSFMHDATFSKNILSRDMIDTRNQSGTTPLVSTPISLEARSVA
jgi:hypothetical protein